MALPVDELVQKAATSTTNMAAIIPQLWAGELEPNLRKREVFQQSIHVNTDLVGEPGDRVFLPTLPDLDSSNMDLTEGTDMTLIPLNDATSVQFTPAEVGKGVEITRKALDRMKYDGMSQIVDRLAYAMSLKIEGAIASLHSASVPGTSNKLAQVYPNGHSSANIVVADTLTSAVILDSVAQLKTLDNVPFDDGLFRFYIHPNQTAKLLRDPDVRNDLRWAQPETMLRGEIGVYHNCRIIESTHVKQVNEGSGSAVPVYKSLLLAPRWAAVAYKRLPEIMVDPTVYDMGRKRRFGITADFHIALLHNERGLVVTTA